MTEWLLILVAGLMLIAAAAMLSPRLGIAAPIILVAFGVAASFAPALRDVEIDPEWILAGVLPPLLYSAAVSLPTMNFRREFGAISGLSVLLVVGTSLVLGVLFMFVIPGIGFAWGVALGAIISPTDAVATSIVKRTAVSKRVIAMLEGESLLNDATALVLLRTAIVATAASFSVWGAVGTFASSVAIAAVLGGVVGWANLWVRRRVTDSTVNTVISFTVPFAASVPAELLGGSGLVAAVVAGLITGIRAPRMISPQHRLSDGQNWRTVELVLEGAVFLTMGLQLSSIVSSVEKDHAGVGAALLIALGALIVTIAVRAGYVASLLGVLSRRRRGSERFHNRLQEIDEQIATPEGRDAQRADFASRGRPMSERQWDRFVKRVTRGIADLDYFMSAPLGWRDGVAVVWAGMRGAVTVAAAQTLPAETPQRSLLVFIAFVVALASLLLQGGTIGPLLRWIAPAATSEDSDANLRDERTEVMRLLRASGDAVPEPERPETPRPEQFEIEKRYRLAVLEAQRTALLDARDNGTYDAELLADQLTQLDAAQIAIELRG